MWSLIQMGKRFRFHYATQQALRIKHLIISEKRFILPFLKFLFRAAASSTFILSLCTKGFDCTDFMRPNVIKQFFYIWKVVSECWSLMTHWYQVYFKWVKRDVLVLYATKEKLILKGYLHKLLVHEYSVLQMLHSIITHNILFTHCFVLKWTLLLWLFNIVTVNALQVLLVNPWLMWFIKNLFIVCYYNHI